MKAGGSKAPERQRPAPPHKQVPGTQFIVDGFRFNGGSAYFLTHGHSDHYQGLSPTWNLGPVYCTDITATLMRHMFGLRPGLLHSFPLDTPFTVEGVQVTFVDANHCPGAAQVLFDLPDGQKYIHSGDMRYTDAFQHNTHLERFRGCSGLYLDTTYCRPKHTFPSQEESCAYVADRIAEQLHLPGDAPTCLFLISTYGIGKERLLSAVARRTGCLIYVTPDKLAVLRCLDLADTAIYTTNPQASPVHVVQWGRLGETWPFFKPNWASMEEYRKEMGVDQVIGFVPTGWMYEMKKAPFSHRSKGASTVHLVPYSEHSSFSELREYVRWVRPHKVVPTVGVDEKAGRSKEAERVRSEMLAHFRNLVNETASKRSFLSAFGGEAAAPAAAAAGSKTISVAIEEADGEGDEGIAAEEPLMGDAGPLVSAAEVDMEADTEEEEEPEGAAPATAPAAAAAPVAAPAGGARWGASGRPQGAAAVAPLHVAAFSSGLAAAAATPSGGRPPTAAQSAPSTSGRASGAGAAAVGGDAARAQLQAVIPFLSDSDADRLLRLSGGSVEAAVSRHFDGGGGSAIGVSGGAGVGGGGDGAGAGSGGEGGRGGAAVAAAAPKSVGKSKPVTVGGSGGGKGKGKGAAAAAAAGSGQRSIATFFSSPGAKAAAATRDDASDSPAKASAGSRAAMAQRQNADATDSAAASPAVEEARAPSVMVEPARSPAKGGAAAADGDAGAAGEALGSPAVTQRRPKGGLAFFFPCPQPSPQPLLSGAEEGAEPSGEGAPGAAAGGGAALAAAQPLTDPSADPLAGSPIHLPVGEYDPVRHACWQRGQPTPYLHIAVALEYATTTKKRLKIADALCNCFRSILALSPEDLLPALYLFTGRVAPDFEGVELRVGEATVSGAVAEVTGTGSGRMREIYKELGDLGDVAFTLKKAQRLLRLPVPLTVRGVFATLKSIASSKGTGSVGRKKALCEGLIRSARGPETRFLVRTLIANLRIGANRVSVLGALAQAVVVNARSSSAAAASPEASSAASGKRASAAAGRAAGKALAAADRAEMEAAVAAVSQAYSLCPSYDTLVPALVRGGIAALSAACRLVPGIPVSPMLAQPAVGGVAGAVAAIGADGSAFIAEYKYDGTRAQIHLCRDGTFRAFSRNNEDRSGAFPDVAAAVREAAQGGRSASLVLDAELVAVDPANGNRPCAFQDLAGRGRGQVELEDVQARLAATDRGWFCFREPGVALRGAALRSEVHVCCFVFDILSAEFEDEEKGDGSGAGDAIAGAAAAGGDGAAVPGGTLAGLSLRERRRVLFEVLPGLRTMAGRVELAKGRIFRTPPEIAAEAADEAAEREEGGAAVGTSGRGSGGKGKAGRGGRGGKAAAAAVAAAMAAEAQRAAAAQQQQQQQQQQQAGGSPSDTPQESAAPLVKEEEEAEEATESVMRELLLQSVADGCEGLMLKRLSSIYEPGKRSSAWVKLKKDYCDDMSESLDLVPIGAWYGNGRKTGWFSPFLLAAYDPETEEYSSVCRVMSGFTDVFYEKTSAFYRDGHILPAKPHFYSTKDQPSVWFEPLAVWEIRGADFSLSPKHTAALGRVSAERGIAMRFPRFIRLREDRSPENASGPDEVEGLYRAQTRQMRGGGAGRGGSGPVAKGAAAARGDGGGGGKRPANGRGGGRGTFGKKAEELEDLEDEGGHAAAGRGGGSSGEEEEEEEEEQQEDEEEGGKCSDDDGANEAVL